MITLQNISKANVIWLMFYEPRKITYFDFFSLMSTITAMIYNKHFLKISRDFKSRKPSRNQIVSSNSLYARGGEQCQRKALFQLLTLQSKIGLNVRPFSKCAIIPTPYLIRAMSSCGTRNSIFMKLSRYVHYTMKIVTEAEKSCANRQFWKF